MNKDISVVKTFACKLSAGILLFGRMSLAIPQNRNIYKKDDEILDVSTTAI